MQAAPECGVQGRLSPRHGRRTVGCRQEADTAFRAENVKELRPNAGSRRVREEGGQGGGSGAVDTGDELAVEVRPSEVEPSPRERLSAVMFSRDRFSLSKW